MRRLGKCDSDDAHQLLWHAPPERHSALLPALPPCAARLSARSLRLSPLPPLSVGKSATARTTRQLKTREKQERRATALPLSAPARLLVACHSV